MIWVWISLMAASSCANYAITTELELLSTAFACVSTSNYYRWVFIPCDIACNNSIFSWCYSGGGVCVWGRGGTQYMFYNAAAYPHLPAVVTARRCSLWDQWKNNLKVDHILMSVACWRYSMMSLLKVAVCARRSIPFDTIMVLAIILPTAIANYHQFSSWLMMRARCYMGSYAPIFFTKFPRGQFRLLPCITWRDVVTPLGPPPVRSL